jgi:hypothetical protein
VRSGEIYPNTNAARGEAESDESDESMNPLILYESRLWIRNRWGMERNANVQELSEASDQAIQKPDLALKDLLSGISQ